ncbi:MAG TPA: flavodoxin domain-containing protein [Spirochaetia bacterium]|nr:flavodoxin domain-containing protein [Spirochaetia bacterium]
MKCVVIYWSKTGNTRKVALALKEGLSEAGADVAIKTVEEASDIDFFDYDLICLGSPSYNWRPPEPVDRFLKSKFSEYRQKGRIVLGAPQVPGKDVLVFCTYSGPHTGVNEAVPVGKYMGQFFEHLGFFILDEWYVLCEFRGSEENSTRGRMGDIRGLPTAEDLETIRENAEILYLKITRSNPSSARC